MILHRFISVFLIVAGSLLLVGEVQAQEFDCSVQLDYSALSGSDFDFLDDLGLRIDEYINEHRWTDDRFQPYERIDCDVQVVVLEAMSQTSFEAQLIVSARRPIYGTVQSTPTIRFSDSNWRFDYSRGQALTHNLNQHDDLVSMLDFYMYVLLGYDYDTFSERGGTDFFQTARRIKERADAAGGQGWSSVGGRDRESIISDLLDTRFQRLRDAYFIYHFSAVDRFLEDADNARDSALEALEHLFDLYQDVSRRYVIDLFFSVKHTELKAIFEGARQSTDAYQILNRMDPSHDYSELLE